MKIWGTSLGCVLVLYLSLPIYAASGWNGFSWSSDEKLGTIISKKIGDNCYYELTIGNPPDWLFDSAEGVKSTLIENISDTSVTCFNYINANRFASEMFSLEMKGKLKRNGTELGAKPDWDAAISLTAPLRVVEKVQAGLKATYSAFRGADAVAASWKGASGLNIATATGLTTEVSATEPGDYILNATHQNEEVEAVFTRLKVCFKDDNGVELSSVKIPQDGYVIVASELQPASAVGKYGIGKTVQGTNITCSGEIPGNVKIQVGVNNGSVKANYGSDVVGSLGVEVVEVGIQLHIVP